jgi:hypothetical protein
VKQKRTYFVYLLLIAFAWVITPVHTIHDLFADHEDTADNYCLVNHSHLGVHVESKHTHCEVLEFNASVYFKTDLVTIKGPVNTIITLVDQLNLQQVICYLGSNLPSRAPPVLA